MEKDKMFQERKESIRKIWQGNALMQVLKIRIDEVHEGGATLSMPIDFDVHTNHWLGVHGGALATLADSVCGILRFDWENSSDDEHEHQLYL